MTPTPIKVSLHLPYGLDPVYESGSMGLIKDPITPSTFATSRYSRAQATPYDHPVNLGGGLISNQGTNAYLICAGKTNNIAVEHNLELWPKNAYYARATAAQEMLFTKVLLSLPTAL
ncbi:hypothetical protein LguiB_032351 [Lonicera macranthoides]